MELIEARNKEVGWNEDTTLEAFVALPSAFYQTFAVPETLVVQKRA